MDLLMAKKSQPNLEQYQDVRLSATTRIWVITVAILGVCIPLSAITRSGAILPLVAIGGAAVGTVAVWRSDEQKSKTNYLQQQQIELLERRLANLETIVSSDDLNLQMKIKQIEARDTFSDSSDVSTTPRQPKGKG
jgi:Tfp pilus assembly protein PilN